MSKTMQIQIEALSQEVIIFKSTDGVQFRQPAPMFSDSERKVNNSFHHDYLFVIDALK